MVYALPVISTPLAVAAVAAHHAVVDERAVHELAAGQRIVIGPSMPFPALPEVTSAATPRARRLFSPIELPGEVAAPYTPSPRSRPAGFAAPAAGPGYAACAPGSDACRE